MPILHKNELPEQELFPGLRGKMVHTDSVTVADFYLDEGTLLPLHHHPHEQISTILEGTFEFVIDGQVHLCTPGHVATIPANVPHSGRAITACRIMDVFTPCREDYRLTGDLL